MEKQMTRLVKAPRRAVLAACLSGLLAVAGAASSAHADSTIACSALSTNAGDVRVPPALEVVKTEALYRFQDRPYVRIPQGVALWVKAPRGLTAADLHNLLRDCARTQPNEASPVCVKDAQLSVDRSGGYYVVRVTSEKRSTALEIQRRAQR
jgi:hypothetical protein